MRKQTKLVAVLSAAALLAIGASMTSFAATGWAEEDGAWVFLDKDGDRVYDTWKKSAGVYFYLDDNGEMATDRIVETDEDTFYVDSQGAKVTNAWISVENEDSDTVDGKEVDTLWYYFGSNGKAIKAKSGELRPKEISSANGKAKYVFDDAGRMCSGWTEVDSTTSAGDVDLYYLGDENQGWAVTDWLQLEPKEVDAEGYDELKWFYFGTNGKAAKDTTKYIKGFYYEFDENGVMKDGWFTATPPSAVGSGSNAHASGSGALGTGWIYTTAVNDSDGDPHWYYLVNLRDADDKVIRSIPFNYDKENGYAAKSIKGKTYLFKNNGQMETGLITLEDKVNETTLGSEYITSKALEKGIYYFNEADGSVNGQMATGKTTVEIDDEKYYYYFNDDGKAYQDAVVKGVLYGTDGKRISAEDGNTYRVYTVKDNPITIGDDKIEPGKKMIVNQSGKVKTNGDVKIDGKEYHIENNVVAPKPAKK